MFNQIAAELEAAGAIALADGAALEVLCDAWQEYRDLGNKITTRRREDKVTMHLRVARDKAGARVSALLREFGLSPASRKGVRIGDVPRTGGVAQRRRDRQAALDEDDALAKFMLEGTKKA